MKRVYADLHLRLNVENPAETLRIINKVSQLGYRLIAVPLEPETRQNEVEKLQKVCKEAGVDFASRLDLRPRTSNELMVQLRRFRRKFEVICVACENKQVARQAAKDRRVDLISFPLLDFRHRFFDKAEAELASNGLVALEVDVNPLLILDGASRVRLLSSLQREAGIARRSRVPIVVSSGVAAEMLLRKPRELAALAFLFGLDKDSTLDAVSRNPHVIVKRNREKLDSGFVAPGIRVIKDGKDC
jgi:RNase P/RNase MRP subunit p30